MKLVRLVVATAFVSAAAVVAPITAASASGAVATSNASATAGYIDPLAGEQWLPARTDQGVDWMPVVPEAVRAIGAGVVTYSSTTDCHWPGCAAIVYELTAGPKAGTFIYVTEHLSNLVPVGTQLQPGQTIATALPGYPWTEWGWAAPNAGAVPASPYNGLPDGTPTAGGLEFTRFMIELGDTPLQNPGPGPDTVP